MNNVPVHLAVVKNLIRLLTWSKFNCQIKSIAYYSSSRLHGILDINLNTYIIYIYIYISSTSLLLLLLASSGTKIDFYFVLGTSILFYRF